MTEKKIMTIDCEPKHSNLVPLYVEWIRTGVIDNRELAVKEITKWAKIVDYIRQAQKQNKIFISTPKGMFTCDTIEEVNSVMDDMVSR